MVHGLETSPTRAASCSQGEGRAPARSPRCLRGSEVAARGWVWEQSRGKASEQQKLILKPWRMLQG